MIPMKSGMFSVAIRPSAIFIALISLLLCFCVKMSRFVVISHRGLQITCFGGYSVGV